MRYTVLLENYIKRREIEVLTLISMAKQYVLPAGFRYKKLLLEISTAHPAVKNSTLAEKSILAQLDKILDQLYQRITAFEEWHKTLASSRLEEVGQKLAREGVQGLSEVAVYCRQLEEIVPHELWPLPKFYDMLFTI